MNQSTLFRSQRVKWITLALLLAAFAALLTTSFALAQSDSKTIMYAENGTGPVANLAAMDPEGDDFTWELSGGYDMDSFKIDEDTGVLTFEMPPDYEDPQDNGGNNSYVVEVMAEDTKEEKSKKFTVTVQVTEVAEMGEVTWTIDGMNLVQFEVGAELVADLTDGDVEGSSKVPADIDWQWYRSDSMTGMGTAISGEIGDSYTATSDDVGKYLRVVGIYTVGGGDDETAYRVSGYPVLAERDDNTAPEFSSTSVAREVNEGMKGMTVGDPVTATDDGPGKLTYVLGGTDAAKFAIDRKTGQITTKVDLDHEDTGDDANCDTRNECEVTVTAYDSAGDDSSPVATVTITIKNVNEAPKFAAGGSPKAILTYENRTDLYDATDGPLTAESEVTYAATDPEGQNVNYSLRGDDRLRFVLSEEGVLSFKAMPDFEKPTDRDRDNVYEVTVRASDSTERTDRTEHTDRMVTVTVMNVNEAPVISGDEEVSYAENGTGPVFTFKATDPEGDNVHWSVPTDLAANDIDAIEDADDADNEHFSITDGGKLTFTAPPDFEAPSGEAGTTSNTYKVVVVASDAMSGGMTNYHKVEVMVTNKAENGVLAWSQTPVKLQHDAGDALSVTLTDGDVVTGTLDISLDGTDEGYQWYRSTSTSLGSPISGETGSTYTTVADNDVGKYIHVRVYYRVGPETASRESATLKSKYPIIAAREGAAALAFAPITEDRKVKEGKGNNAGSRVKVTDKSNHGAVNYAITGAGADNDKFEIDQKTGQITIMDGWELDFESEAAATATDAGSCAEAAAGTPDRECVVTVTATDATDDATATLTVNIMITSVDERPMFTNTATLEVTIDHKENQASLHESNDGVAESEVTFTAMDPEDGNVTYTLRGADAARFQLSDVQVLSFKVAPNFEMPADRNKDNIYEVTVRASDDSNLHTEHTVKVTVTNVNEAPNITGANPPEEPAPDRDGKVTLSAAPMAGKAVTARLSDPDEPVESTVMWQWSKSMTMGGDFADIDGATSDTYTPMAADEGYYLRATANYDDGHGSDKMAYGTTTAAVAAGIPANLAKFDTSGDGEIDRAEVLAAFDSYFEQRDDAPTRGELLALFDYYFGN